MAFRKIKDLAVVTGACAFVCAPGSVGKSRMMDHLVCLAGGEEKK